MSFASLICYLCSVYSLLVYNCFKHFVSPQHFSLHSIVCWVLTFVPSCMQIDILVVNCSLCNPTPSLSAMIINHFKMRSNIVSYNLGAMGCSAGVIAVNLAKELLQVCHAY